MKKIKSAAWLVVELEPLTQSIPAFDDEPNKDDIENALNNTVRYETISEFKEYPNGDISFNHMTQVKFKNGDRDVRAHTHIRDYWAYTLLEFEYE